MLPSVYSSVYCSQREGKEGVQNLNPPSIMWASEAKERVTEVAAAEPQGSLRGSHL